MGAQRTTFDKLQRDRAKKAKAAAKRERRLDKDGAAFTRSDTDADTAPLSPTADLPASRLLELVEQVHRQFEAKQITYEEFEEKKAELLAALTID